MKTAIAYTDGASLGNPGRAGIGVVILENDIVIATLAKNIGTATNNVAELTAIQVALETALSKKVQDLRIKMDSEWAHHILVGTYKIKAQHLIPTFLAVKELEKKFSRVIYEWIPREENARADALSKEGAMQ